ncbi:MAG TPA: hypothetical protein VKJ07_11640, partial [Mycobacteriales bacterium]|nr:hypothetical protein [Mycobacteriales bacterium]
MRQVRFTGSVRRFVLALAFALLCSSAPAFAQDSTQTARRVVVGVTNDTVTGTTVNRLAKLTGAPSKAIIVADGDTDGAIGVGVSNTGTSGTATVQVAGLVNCVFDNATTADDYVSISATGGRCHDAGATYPATGQVIGQVLSTNGGAGTYQIILLLRRGTPATALADPGGNGYVVRTGAGVTAGRTLTGTANQVSVTNGDGSVGNPVFSLPQNIHTGASPQFAALGLGGAAPASGVRAAEA